MKRPAKAVQRYKKIANEPYSAMNKISVRLKITVLAAAMSLPFTLCAQSAGGHDTLQCFIVGFKFGTMFPSDRFSHETLPSGGTSRNATMYSLYDSPWLDFGVNGFYKFKSNWLLSIDGDFWFGNDNLSHRRERMSHLYTGEGIIIGTNGTDAVVTCYNRGLSAQAGMGRIFPLWPSRNPNSGLLARIGAGPMLQQTVFMLNDVNAPQIDGDNALLYDHQRKGFLLTESLGVWFMSNRSNLINFFVSFEVSQCWSRSTRDYIIDNYLGLNGKDRNRHFDIIYTVKLSWMFPLKGKTARDYYYY